MITFFKLQDGTKLEADKINFEVLFSTLLQGLENIKTNHSCLVDSFSYAHGRMGTG